MYGALYYIAWPFSPVLPSSIIMCASPGFSGFSGYGESLSRHTPDEGTNMRPVFAGSTPDVGVKTMPAPPPADGNFAFIAFQNVMGPLPENVAALAVSPYFAITDLQIPSPAGYAEGRASLIILSAWLVRVKQQEGMMLRPSVHVSTG